MKTWKIGRMWRDSINGEEGIRLFGKSPDHVTPMNIINRFLGQNVLRIAGGGFMVHLWLPECHMQVWSDKIGTREDLWGDDIPRDGEDPIQVLRLDLMGNETSHAPGDDTI